MHSPARLVVVVAALLLSVVACGSGPATSSQPASPAPAQTWWLRATVTQAIPPLDLFANRPMLVITGDGIAVTEGPVPAIFPGPLHPNLVGRQLTGAGQARIVQAARDLGLLSGPTDFSGGGMVMGGVTGHIVLTVDGVLVELTGDPAAQIVCVTTPCEPEPGTPEAFGELWRHLQDLSSWLGAELGPEAPYVPAAYAILVGAPPTPEPGLPQAPADWPLEQPLATFGGPVANGTARCGTVSGADADALRPALQAANQLTFWTQDPEASAAFGLTVRPMVPGEDVCREIFGAG